jgi:hypothetical protein
MNEIKSISPSVYKIKRKLDHLKTPSPKRSTRK